MPILVLSYRSTPALLNLRGRVVISPALSRSCSSWRRHRFSHFYGFRVCTTSCFHVCLLSFLFAALNSFTKALHSSAQRPKLITFMCAYENALSEVQLMTGRNTRSDMAYGSRELSMEVAKGFSTAIFHCRARKSCHRRRMTGFVRRLKNFDLSLLGKAFRSRFLLSSTAKKAFARKSTAIKIEEEIAQLFAFYVRRKNFTCCRVDAFLGSDENAFRDDENAQLATIKRRLFVFK